MSNPLTPRQKGLIRVTCKRCGSSLKGMTKRKRRAHNFKCLKICMNNILPPNANVFHGSDFEIHADVKALIKEITSSTPDAILRYDDESRIKPCSSTVPSIVAKFQAIKLKIEAKVTFLTGATRAVMYTSTTPLDPSWNSNPCFHGLSKEAVQNSFIPWIRRYNPDGDMEAHTDDTEEGRADQTWSYVLCIASNGEGLMIARPNSPPEIYHLFTGDFIIFKSNLHHQAQNPQCVYRTVLATQVLCD